MQFVTNGPDIPEALLHAHEDGRVVFFCGAGISYPAGLPGFKGLVEEVYRRIGTNRTDVEEAAFKVGQFDATLDLLEHRLPGQRLEMRTALATALVPKLRRTGATDTHAALLQLARSRENALKLVTTNFDRVFETVVRRERLALESYAAPMLPIPKNSRWNGLVYLHGLLPARHDDRALQKLVITSGDFGLAYLTERWAARFVTELFRNYVVCFVGYSINDPVLRYMMDALAADRMLGELIPQAYALGDCDPGHESEKKIEWEAKGVTPILYELGPGYDHSALHKTLKAWAQIYRDGILGKERIVVEHALARPAASTKQDDFVGRMLWALSHDSGDPARRFANINPAPPIEWLEAFSDERLKHGDLNRFGVPPAPMPDESLRFSLLRRPSPYAYAPWMSVLAPTSGTSHWDDRFFHLARWLVRHLNDPKLIYWLSKRGGHLHERWAWIIENELDHIATLERDGKTAELDEIRMNSPNAIPSPFMRTVWRLLLTDRVRDPWRESGLYRWIDRLKRDGLTSSLRFELRKHLAPKVVLKKPFQASRAGESETASDQSDRLVDWDLVLASEDVRSALIENADQHWSSAVPKLLHEFEQCLLDALDLLRELGGADDYHDRSHWDLPSITPHWQNRGFRDWIVLIELLRDGWLEIKKVEPIRAIRIAEEWFELPYAAFKRLALFAASQNQTIEPSQWVNWLLADNAHWLWSVETQRETMRLLVLQSSGLQPAEIALLSECILAGPPRTMFLDGIEAAEWDLLSDNSIWLRLIKLKQGGVNLDDRATRRYEKIATSHPDWVLESYERDEFSSWMTGTGDPDFEESREIDIAPRTRKALVKWLMRPTPQFTGYYQDNWLETCKSRFLQCFYALSELTGRGVWPAARWGDALQAWSELGKHEILWGRLASLLNRFPDNAFEGISRSVARWLETTSKSNAVDHDTFLQLCRRVLSIEHKEGVVTDRSVMRAINHPVGHVTQALLNYWLQHAPNDNDQIPESIRVIFIELFDRTREQLRHGRVVLSSRLIVLFRVDRSWTEEYLLPSFDWKRDATEARAVWEGFLWSPRLYWPLLTAFKAEFLQTAENFDRLAEHRRSFCAFLTYAALDPLAEYSSEEFRAALASLPKEGLQEVARVMSQALDAAGAQREDYWVNRIQPFWRNVWPKSKELATRSVSESLARLTIAAGNEFPSALNTTLSWLVPVEHPSYVTHRLLESGLAESFPEDALRFLHALILDQPWPPADLIKNLEMIRDAEPTLAQDFRYQRLLTYARRAVA